MAHKYDVMNDAMSLGIHRLWKDMLLHVMHPQPGVRLLDVAGGTGITLLCSHPQHNCKPHLLWPFFCLCWSSPTGDIAFRFLEYVRSQQERQKRRLARTMQTPSWQDISNNYFAENDDGPQESRAVVCDINQEMLKVGKQKADSVGISAGMFLTVKLLQELRARRPFTAFSPKSEVLLSMFTGFRDIPIHTAVKTKMLWL